MTSLLETYLAKGILEGGIRDDGGEQCYVQIPRNFLIYFNTFIVSVYVFFIWKWHHTTNSHATKVSKHKQYSPMESTSFDKLVAWISIITLILKTYYKTASFKGLFILNPCHITLGMMVVLLLKKSTPAMLKFHTYWTAWLFGAYMALIVPHIEGITNFQIFLYYVQHLLIVPIGPIILSRRYGFLKPGLTNQLSAYASVLIYQCVFLTPISRISKVNLNFTLCHSHADPFYDLIGYGYYPIASLHLNIVSYLFRWLSYLLVKLWNKIIPNKPDNNQRVKQN